MEQKTPSNFAAGLMPGIYTGAALIVFRLILFLLDVDRESMYNFTIYIVLVLGLYMGIVSYRDKYLSGVMSYGKVVGSGFAIGLIASVILGIFTYFYVMYIDTTMVADVLLQAEENMLAQNPNMTDEQLEQGLKMAAIFTTPTAMAIMGFIVNLIVSVILSLIIAIFAKREDRSIA